MTRSDVEEIYIYTFIIALSWISGFFYTAALYIVSQIYNIISVEWMKICLTSLLTHG